MEDGALLELKEVDKRKVVEASWLVEDAFRGFARPHPKPTAQAIMMYKIYHRIAVFRRTAVSLLLLVSFAEEPYWCHGPWPHPCGDPSDPATPLTSNSHVLTKSTSAAVELGCLAICLLNDMLLYKALDSNFFARFDRIAVLCLFVADIINSVIRLATPWSFCARLAPFFRLFIFMLTFHSIRSTYRKMYLVMAQVQNIISLVSLYVVFFAWLATILFQDTEEATIMQSFGESCWQLLILLTTANFPDVMMPAYTRNRAYGLFFVVFVAFGLFFMMNLILAQVFSNFQHIASMEETQRAKNREMFLTEAFELLVAVQSARNATPTSPQPLPQERRSSSPTKRQQVVPPPMPASTNTTISVEDEEECTWIDMELALCLFEELNHYNVASTRMKRKHMLQIFHKLDKDGDGCIELGDFFAICDAMGKFVKAYHKPPSEMERWFPHVTESAFFQRLCTIVEHKRFELAVDGVLALNALCIVGEVVQTKADDGEFLSVWEVAQLVFSTFYVVEMLLKITVKGFRDYVHYFRNCFDAVITIASLAVDIYAYIPNSFNDHTMAKVLMTFRCVRMLRLFLSIERYRVIISTAFAMVPLGKNLLLVMFCNMTLFALIGHQLFGGRISPSLLASEKFANSSYAAAGYAANNFNDLSSGMVTLFELLVVNNWFVIVEGHVLVTSLWARLFFVAFWLTGVIMTLNLIVASILDAFSKEYAAAYDKLKTTSAAPPPSPSRHRRHLMEGTSVNDGRSV
ncbi:hypothetical protein AeMF1_017504 [Aphanomyces euteiches]|nr:hypothetical protein AeMF1_017504 [Aphanomyces euteiches]KAH9186791.1 hypothetical protein AeNC1_011233 [Aphanomyces euteiches]